MPYTTPSSLIRYSFWWSEARLLIAALALFIGGVPPVMMLPFPSALMTLVFALLKVAWIISGIAAAYLLYQWLQNGQKVFGGKDRKDTLAFFVMVISGINLGITGIVGSNIGMSILSSYVIFVIVGVLYLWTAYRLYVRWNNAGKRLFS